MPGLKYSRQSVWHLGRLVVSVRVMEGWKKLLLAAAGAAGQAAAQQSNFCSLFRLGAGCVLYYLLREDAENKQQRAQWEQRCTVWFSTRVLAETQFVQDAC